jgi:hypothetical protein
MTIANPHVADAILRELQGGLSDSERMERINGRVQDFYPGSTPAERSQIADDIWDEHKRRESNRVQWGPGT